MFIRRMRLQSFTGLAEMLPPRTFHPLIDGLPGGIAECIDFLACHVTIS
jgi:hypothetical protein